MEFELVPVESGTDLIVHGNWSDYGEQILASGRADGLVLNYALGFKESNLEFLRDWPLKRLNILDRSISDLSPVYRLAGTLTELRVQTEPSAILDLAQLPLINALGAGWRQIRDSITNLEQLRDLFLLSFGGDDLTVFRANKALERIRMKDRPKIRSLNGFQDLQQLRSLEIHLASRLQDISELRGVKNEKLQILTLEMCRGINDLENMTDLKALKSINVSECGEIGSLKPLVVLQDLEEFHMYGSTKIRDNDLSPLLSLPHLRQLRIQSRRTYQPSAAEIQAGLPH